MAKKPVLVVLAAGMGSRYGGLKQIDPVGSQGEAILDYSIYDAHQAGFDTVVIIIKEAIKKDFLETVGKRLERAPVEIRYAYQELTDLPAGFTVPEGRVKPWGTAHAVFCAREAIDGAPFAVVNADDYYGKAAFMVGYELGKTVTENGSVARGICQVNANGYLEEVIERTHIETYPGGIRYLEDGIYTDVSPDTIVSMNMWGFMPSFLDELEGRFSAFLKEALKTNPLKCEFFLPLPITQLIQEKKATFRVLSSPDRWFGVTYAADKPMVVNALKAMTDAGKYPDGLWK